MDSIATTLHMPRDDDSGNWTIHCQAANKVETKTIFFKADGDVEGYSAPSQEVIVTKPPQPQKETVLTSKSLTEPDIVEAKEDANKDCCIIL